MLPTTPFLHNNNSKSKLVPSETLLKAVDPKFCAFCFWKSIHLCHLGRNSQVEPMLSLLLLKQWNFVAQRCKRWCSQQDDHELRADLTMPWFLFFFSSLCFWINFQWGCCRESSTALYHLFLYKWQDKVSLGPLADGGEKSQANQLDFILTYLGFVSLLLLYSRFLFLMLLPPCQWFSLGPRSTSLWVRYTGFSIVHCTRIKSVYLAPRL